MRILAGMLILGLGGFLAACQTSPLEESFKDSKVGDPKGNSVSVVFVAPCTVQCDSIRLIQVLHMVDGDKKTLPNPIDGFKDPSPLHPEKEDVKAGYVVDKKERKDVANSEKESEKAPYYGGATIGSKKDTTVAKAQLDDTPGPVNDGTKAVFEVCAFCEKGRDKGKYLGCITWEIDGKTQTASKGAPMKEPTQEFKDAVKQWNDRHGYAMPVP